MPIICVSPVGNNRQLFLNPDGSFQLLISRQETNAKNLEEAIGAVFDLRPNDPKINTYCLLIKEFQQRFYGKSSSGRIGNIASQEVQKRAGSTRKIRFPKQGFGDWEVAFKSDKNDGQSTYTIT